MSTDPFERPATRREFVKLGMGTSALALCGGCSLFVTTREPDLTLEASSGAIRFSEEALEAGSVAISVEGMDDKVLVFRTPDDSLAAVSMRCTHWGCDVDYVPDRERIVCPCHGSEFDLGGGNLKGPAELPLRAYPVHADGGDVVVEIR